MLLLRDVKISLRLPFELLLATRTTKEVLLALIRHRPTRDPAVYGHAANRILHHLFLFRFHRKPSPSNEDVCRSTQAILHTWQTLVLHHHVVEPPPRSDADGCASVLLPHLLALLVRTKFER